MATIPGTETIADAMIAKLEAGLAARVAAVNADKADGIEITTPEVGFVGGFDDALGPQHPAIIVTELTSQEYGEEGPHSFILSVDVGVVVYDLDTSRQTLARKLWRQARAVTECLWDDDPKEALTDAAFRLHPVRHAPGPIFDQTDERSMWAQFYVVVFRASQFAG